MLLMICFLFIVNAVRVLRIDRKHPLLRVFADYMQQNFPDYRENPYLEELSKARCLAFSLLERRQYWALWLLFRFKGQ